MKRPFTALAALVCSLFTGVSQARKEGAARPYSALEMTTSSTEAPMLPGDEIMVEVRIDGRGPYRFSLDTGAEDAGSINRSLAKTLGLKVAGKVLMGDPSGKNQRQSEIYEAGTLSFGGATFRRVRLSARGVAPGSRAEAEFDGMLGIRLFEELLLILDYGGRKVRIEKGELPPADGREILDYDQPQGVPRIRIKIGDLEVPADVDCGNVQGELVLPSSYIDKVPLLNAPVVVGHGRTEFNEFEIKQAPLKGALRIGDQAIEGVRIDFVEIFPVANIGNVLLRRFTVTLDGKNHRIRFRRLAD